MTATEPTQDTTPSVIDQAKAQGWTGGIFNFGKAEGPQIHHFNCGLVERPDGLWLIVRRAVFDGSDSFGLNSVWAFQLDPLTLKPVVGQRLKFPGQDNEQFEDPRCVYRSDTDQTLVGVCNFIWYGNGQWTGAHQILGVFNEKWECLKRYDPEIGGNSKTVDERGKRLEKNWLWFFDNNKLTVLYHSDPWRMAQFGQSWTEATPYETVPGITWRYGEPRGGTPPVLVDDVYWTFFHSSLPWQGRFRRYYMGAIGFESKPPFTPLFITPEPILTGSQKDPWAPNKPLVVFPCGSRIKDGEWLITYGINDLRCGWLRLPHSEILKLAKSIGGDATRRTPEHHSNVVDLSNRFATSKPETERRCTNGDHGTLGDRIRYHIKALVTLENGQTCRKARILSELRQYKLVPGPR